MAFLNPFILFGLAAAAIPLLLHLLNLRRMRVVEFSSLRFLKELQKTRLRALKLKQILLMLLRVALIVFAVLAFARPAVRTSLALPGSHASSTAVILFDDSFSMGARDASGERLQQARAAAREVVDMLEQGDAAFLVPMTDPGSAVDAEPTHNRESLRRRIDEMKLSYRRADLDDAMRVAARLFDRSETVNKELYIVTDAQRGNVRGATDSLKLFSDATRVYVVPIGDRTGPAASNLALDSIRILSTVYQQEKPVDLRAWVHNYGEKRVENAVVSMYVDDNRIAQGSVTLDAGQSQSIDLSAPPKRAGMVGGYVEVSGDEFEADNRRYFSFRVLDRLRTALIGDPSELRYLELVLGVSGNAVTLQKFPPSSLGSIDLSNFSTVVLVDVPRLTPADATRLSQYLERGGGLVIYGGPHVDRAKFNQTLGAAVGMGLGAPVNAGARQAFTFSYVQREHPMFEGVFDPNDPGEVESPDVQTMMPASGGETVIRLSNGQPFMSEFRRGRGRIVYIGVPPTTEWSTLPTEKIFVPIAIRSVRYVGATGEAFERVTVGETATLVIRGQGTLPERVRVTPPSGEDEFVPVRQYPTGAYVVYDHTTQPGVYHVSSGNEDIALFTVNVGSGESDLTPMSQEQLRSRIGAHMIDPDKLTILDAAPSRFRSEITESRQGLELWRYLLGLAIICAFIEMFLGRTPKRGEQ